MEYSLDSLISENQYITQFSDEIDDLNVDLESFFEDNSFEDISDEKHTQLDQSAREWADKLGFDYDAEKNRVLLLGEVYCIISVTGDDEAINPSTFIVCFLLFSAARILSQIRVSDKDTGVSNMLGNFTEGWITIPPNAEADFFSVKRRHLRNGVPVVFDITKLKATSAVRKQSTKELDFETKFEQLEKARSWTPSEWFTYDYANVVLVVASAIFDFNDCKTFPYLYKQEGGCGGTPPWNNIDTARSALSYFNNGKSQVAILSIMEEATLIQENKLSPKDSVYISASHYAQVGDKILPQISQAKRYLQSFKTSERARIFELCKGVEPLPPELVELGIIVEPEDKLIGAAISEMRQNGLIMTELDVRLKNLSRDRVSHLLGEANMGSVILEQELERKNIKKNGLKELARIASMDPLTNTVVERDRSTLLNYYQTRMNYSDITGLSYEGLIRVFKTSDVQRHYEDASLGLADEIIASLESYKNFNMNKKTGSAKANLEYQIDWMEKGELIDLFEGEIPPSLGSDDARISRKIILDFEQDDENDHLVAIVISNDSQMEEDLKTLTRNKGKLLISRISVYEYVKACYKPDKSGREIFNFLRGVKTRTGLIDQKIRDIMPWRSDRGKYKLYWDFPNVNRTLEGLRQSGTRLYRITGGFLQKTTLMNESCWAAEEWQQFKNRKDFERTLHEYTVR